MGYGRVNVAYKAVSDVTYMGNKAWERMSIYYRSMAAYKSFLNKDDMWVVAVCIRIEGSKLRVDLESTSIL